MTPELQFENGKVADTTDHCDECGATLLAGWEYCPHCGRERHR